MAGSSRDLARNRFRWLNRARPDIEAAVDWACAQFPPEVQRRGIARDYYEYLWVLGELAKTLPGGFAGLRIADIGCGSGVYALALTRLGARVTAVDQFAEYEDTFDNQMGRASDIVPRLERHGIAVVRRDLAVQGLPPDVDGCDVLLLLAVIEHLHESPRRLLGVMHEKLQPGGVVVVTTPNQAWIRTRLRLLLGRSAYHPLAEWWQTPFFGHVREFTMDELVLMLRWSGFTITRTAISSWGHVASRRRGRSGEPDTWTTSFTFGSAEQLIVAGSLLLTALIRGLRYYMLAVGRKPHTGDV